MLASLMPLQRERGTLHLLFPYGFRHQYAVTAIVQHT